MKKNGKRPENTILFVCILFLIYFISQGIKSGCVNPRGGEEYCLTSSPNMYYFILVLYAGLTLASVFKISINLMRKK
jgi:hypothetical protein